MAVIGLDLGATKIAGALFTEDGRIINREGMQVSGRKGSDVGRMIISVISNLLNTGSGEKITAVGICVPGIAYRHSGNVWAPNIPGWKDYPLRSEIEHHFTSEIPVVSVESDRTCYILGELWQGAARGCNDVIYLSVGTGIGAGILTGGRVLHGAGDIAGAVGWMALQSPFTDEYVECGCFEYYASGAGIARNARKLLKESGYDGLFYGKKVDDVEAADVFKAYKLRDKIALRVIGKAVELWGMASANLVSIFDPEKIIFGGGVFGPASDFISEIKKEAEKWAQPVSIRKVKFEASELKGDAGIFGSGYLALHPGEFSK